jgi:hypothetical protein
MAFNLQRFTRHTLAFNSGSLTLEDASIANGPAFFSYASATDAIATIEAANYFNDESVIYDLKVDDVIMVIASDSNTFLQVATVDTTTSPKTITTVPFTAAATVDTANLVDGAVTNAKVNAAAGIEFSKLETLASTNILVGSAGGVATSRAMTGDITIGNTGVTAIGANKVLSSMLSPLVMKYTTVAVTAAEFNGMYAAPKLLLAAGGANTLIIVHRIDLLMTYGAAAFAGGGVAAAQYDSTANGAGVIATSTLSAATFQATASTGFMFNTGVVPQTFSTCVNKGIYLSNITGAFTTGDSNFVAHIYYSVIPTV